MSIENKRKQKTLNSPNCIAEILLLAVTILACFSFYSETSAQESNALTSPFELCWELKTDQISSLDIASDNDLNIYLSLLSGEIESINFMTGKKKWQSKLGGEIALPPLSDNKSVYIVSKIKTKILVRSLSTDSGITNWQVSFDFDDEFFLIKDSDKLVIISKGGKFSVFNKITGVVIRSGDLGQELSSAPILSDNQIVFGTMSKKIIFYSLINGNILAQFDVSYPPNIVFVIKSRYIFWSDYKGNAYLSDLIAKKVLWKIRGGAGISNILATQQGLLISSLDNFIYLVSIKKGKFVWKKRFNGNVSFSPITNEYIVVVISGSEFADIIDTESGRLVNQLVISGNNYFINKPLVSDNLFIFPTIKGLFAYTNSRAECAYK